MTSAKLSGPSTVSATSFVVRLADIVPGGSRLNTGDPDDLRPGATEVYTVVEAAALLDPYITGGSGGVSDGDKGDIVVSGSGTVWSIDYTAVNATIAPVWGNITSKPAAVTALSGTNTGDQTITLTGDVTGSGTGSFAATIAANAVTAAQFQQIATNSIIGRTTIGTGNVQVLTGTQVTAILDAFTSTDKGLAPASGGGTTNYLRADGTWDAPPGSGGGVSDGDKGDIVVSGTGTVWSIDYTAVNAVIAPTWTNVSSKPADLTTIAGLTPSNDDFLQRKAGAWANRTVAQVKTDLGLTGTNSGDQTSIVGITGTLAQFNTSVSDAELARTDAANTFTGTQTFSQQQVQTGLTTDPASPADGTDWYDSRTGSRKTVVGSRTRNILADFVTSGVFAWKAVNGATAPTSIGIAAPTATGTGTAAAIATTSRHTMFPRLEALVTVAAATAVAGFRGTTNLVTLGGASADLGGFRLVMTWGPATGVATATNRAFVGVSTNTSAPTDVEPSTLVNCIGMGWDAADTNIQIMHNDGSGTATKVSTGITVPAVDRTSVYRLELFAPKGTTQSCQWRVTDMVNGTVADGSVNTNLPGTTTLLSPRGWMSAGGTSSVIGIALMSMYLDPLL